MNEQLSVFDLLPDRFTQVLKCGSMLTNGKKRISEAAVKMSVNDLASFLRDEYGAGGHSITFSDGARGFEMHSFRGFKLTEFKSAWKEEHSWSEAAKRIKHLVICNAY